MALVYFGLGTNLGDKERNLCLAIDKIRERIGKVTSQSAFYASEPWGFESANSFLNAVICAETSISPIQLMKKTQEIEKEIGRNKKSVDGLYSDRVIDIDILLYDDLILSTENLTIPHPLMTERLFVMKPLCEIAPELVIPGTEKTVQSFYEEWSL
jgi:2-amino-4-hydroxy-6-hydroxymethyldihydropteridine diphosphokinase